MELQEKHNKTKELVNEIKNMMFNLRMKNLKPILIKLIRLWSEEDENKHR